MNEVFPKLNGKRYTTNVACEEGLTDGSQIQVKTGMADVTSYSQ